LIPPVDLPLGILHSQGHVTPEGGITFVRYGDLFLKRSLEKIMSFSQGPLADALGDIVLEEEEADLMALQGTIIFKCGKLENYDQSVKNQTHHALLS
jgi:hypothetical protein